MLRVPQRQWRPYMVILGFFLLMFSLYHWTTIDNTPSSASRFTEQQHMETALEKTVTQKEFNNEANHTLTAQGITTPLLLQTDELWANTLYGQDGNRTIAENGCALLSLAMILAHWFPERTVPQEIFDWAKESYYVQGQGTDWRIFADFAQHFKLSFHDLNSDLAAADSYLQQNIPVVVSVTKGEFTEGGHIMVLAASDQKGIRVLDPNDSPEKGHYAKEYSFDTIRAQSLHYWTFTGL